MKGLWAFLEVLPLQDTAPYDHRHPEKHQGSYS
jgi:hypothetical protein